MNGTEKCVHRNVDKEYKNYFSVYLSGQILDTFVVHLNYKSQTSFENAQRIIDAVNKFR